MKILVIYDSNFGNTKMIADAIAESVQGRAISVKEISAEMMENVNLLIVGSPINAWQATEKIRQFLNKLPLGSLVGVQAAAFDTRVKIFIVKIFISGNAGKKISKSLLKKGATIVCEPKGFYVKGNEGPLLEGEIANAKDWGYQILKKIKK
jgi:flavodoxin